MPEPIRCLTIHQPYSEQIMAGTKVAENRTWDTSYRGPLVIHAGRGGTPGELPVGVLLGVVDLVSISAGTDWPGAELGYRHWELRRPRRFPEPIPVRGRQGIWFLPADLEPMVLRLLRALS